jgi:hypothetical protein
MRNLLSAPLPEGGSKINKKLAYANLSKGQAATFYVQNIYLCLIHNL